MTRAMNSCLTSNSAFSVSLFICAVSISRSETDVDPIPELLRSQFWTFWGHNLWVSMLQVKTNMTFWPRHLYLLRYYNQVRLAWLLDWVRFGLVRHERWIVANWRQAQKGTVVIIESLYYRARIRHLSKETKILNFLLRPYDGESVTYYSYS